MSSRNLQGMYNAALSRIGGTRTSGDTNKCTPIFQRDVSVSRKQAVKDAANALSALWKMGESRKRLA